MIIEELNIHKQLKINLLKESTVKQINKKKRSNLNSLCFNVHILYVDNEKKTSL